MNCPNCNNEFLLVKSNSMLNCYLCSKCEIKVFVNKNTDYINLFYFKDYVITHNSISDSNGSYFIDLSDVFNIDINSLSIDECFKYIKIMVEKINNNIIFI
jgi:hypothetical protein